MKKRLRRKPKYNFYEFRVKHKFCKSQIIEDLLIPSKYSAWRYLGFSEDKKTFLYARKADFHKKPEYRELNEMAVYHYIAIRNIDFILDNAMCLHVHNPLTNNNLRYV